MQISAASSLSIASPIPKAFSPSPSTLSSCNSVFFNHGRKDLFTRNNSSARAMVMTRNRAQKGLSVRCLFGLGVPELAVIGGVALLLFGPKQIPEVGRTIGKTVKGFQQAAKEFETELKKDPEASPIVSSEEKPTANDEGEKQELEASGTFWEGLVADYEAAEPPKGYQGFISWPFLPAIVAGLAYQVPKEYLYIGAAIFVVVFCGIEIAKPDKPHHFPPEIYNMEREARDKFIAECNTMDIWDFSDELWDFTVKKINGSSKND